MKIETKRRSDFRHFLPIGTRWMDNVPTVMSTR